MIEISESRDYNLLAALNEEIQTIHHRMHPDIFKPYNKTTINSFFKATVEKDNTTVFVAKETGTALGYALVFSIDSAENAFQYPRKYILLDQLLVLEKHRAKGIGKLLMDAVFAFAESQHIASVEVHHWTNNKTASHFFLKYGFKNYQETLSKKVSNSP